ncbi:MAG: hypothetical protein BWY70_00750 [Bacteroidetes bacterium ADurb.Bin408]|nr:MAG: hypothetical protein BWY70_00750 [Bacteroidetes bacterium ADurb.Bin408]
MASENTFVFVVCGDDEHIDTLNFSIRYLKHFSKKRIVVITDLNRNKKAIEHDQIVNVKTPEHLNHHQASIYLKTSLHRYLDTAGTCCYIDTDVIAVSKDVDTIFDLYVPPVTFASDHCALREFSPYAVNCDCNENKRNKYRQLDALQDKHNPNTSIKDPFLQDKAKQLIKTFYLQKRKPFRYGLLMARYFLSPRYFSLDDEFYYDKRKEIWHFADGRPVLYSISGYYRKIEKESFFRWHKSRQIWLDDTGENAYIAYCNHLTEEIQKKFGIIVSDKDWQHWNGGVFLFNKESHAFLDAWHDKTMQIFETPAWKTRDQGTLVATAWEFGLQNHKRLPQAYNFIADYYKQNITFDRDKGFSTDKFKTLIKPFFIHVYHEFGRSDWDVWQAIEALLEKSVKCEV